LAANISRILAKPPGIIARWYVAFLDPESRKDPSNCSRVGSVSLLFPTNRRQLEWLPEALVGPANGDAVGLPGSDCKMQIANLQLGIRNLQSGAPDIATKGGLADPTTNRSLPTRQT
jgi:hypothetical protein